MDTSTLVAIAALVLANIGTTIGLFTWATNHASSDNLESRRLAERMQNETLRVCESIQADMRQFQTEMRQFHEELKIIHGRICTVEEKIKPKPVIQK